MTSELTNSSTASHSFTFGTRTKELCSFCNERPFDLVCQCGDKFDFNCIAQHVEALNFQYHDFHVAAGSELTKLQAAKRNVRSDSYQETINSWVSGASSVGKIDQCLVFRFVCVQKTFTISLKQQRMDSKAMCEQTRKRMS